MPCGVVWDGVVPSIRVYVRTIIEFRQCGNILNTRVPIPRNIIRNIIHCVCDISTQMITTVTNSST